MYTPKTSEIHRLVFEKLAVEEGEEGGGGGGGEGKSSRNFQKVE